ncbi:MAG: RNA polymerase sigma-70 factor [Alistipes sp.]|nr:RNA polymerase sigma-70 factor [Alistipes sp.]
MDNFLLHLHQEETYTTADTHMPKESLSNISPSEFAKLFIEYRPRFVAVAYRYVRDMDVAQDLVSDSFMALWETPERLPEDSNIPPYILTTVRNRCLNYLRDKLRHLEAEKNIHNTRSRILEADIRSLSLCDPQKLLTDEISDILARAIQKMPEQTRKVFMYSRFDEMSYAEIAMNLGINVPRVNFEISKALKMLRIEFADYLPILFLLVIYGFKAHL